jgi:hypothetical protein
VAPTPAEPIDVRAANRVSGALLVLGGILLAAGCFFTWATVGGQLGDLLSEVEGFNSTPSGIEDINGEVDGPAVMFFVVGGIAAIVGLLALAGIVNLLLKVVTLVVTVLGSLLAFLILFLILTDDFVKIEGTLDGFPTSVGIGIILCVVGSLATVVGAIRLRRQVT